MGLNPINGVEHASVYAVPNEADLKRHESAQTISFLGLDIGLGTSYTLISLIAILPFMIVFFNLRRREFNPIFAALLLLLIGGVGASLGAGIALHFSIPTLFALVAMGFPLAVLLLRPVLVHRRLLAEYKKSEEHLIQP